jgi:hypothetical protein
MEVATDIPGYRSVGGVNLQARCGFTGDAESGRDTEVGFPFGRTSQKALLGDGGESVTASYLGSRCRALHVNRIPIYRSLAGELCFALLGDGPPIDSPPVDLDLLVGHPVAHVELVGDDARPNS